LPSSFLSTATTSRTIPSAWLGLGDRLALQFFANAAGGLVQDFPEHLRVPALRDGRADALEHVLEEMRDLAAPGGFGFGTNSLPGANDHPGHEEYGRCSKGGRERPVPGAPAPGPLGHVWRARQNRLTPAEPAQFI
jgi:hypothetical protein